MSETDPTKSELKHDLGNEKQQNLALKNLLSKAAAELQELADSDCGDDAKERAGAVADRIRSVLEQSAKR